MKQRETLRVAIINAIAPPAAGSRSERSLHLASALVQQGHDVTVVRGDLPPGFHPVDESMESSLAAAGVQEVVIGGGAIAGWKYANRDATKTSPLRIMAEFAWPDWWSLFGLRARSWYRKNCARFDTVITSAFPWSDLLVGPLAASTPGVVWIADYGDPWGVARSKGRWVETPEFSLERQLLRRCHGVVVTTEPTRKLFVEKYGFSSEQVRVVTAGVEPSHLGAPAASSPLTLLHAGAVYGPRVSPGRFLSAFKQWKLARDGRAKLVWCGPIDDPGLRELVIQVADTYLPYASQARLRSLEADAHAFVVFGNYGGQQIPAKVWRAFGANRPQCIVIESNDDPMTRLDHLCGSAVFSLDNERDILGGFQSLEAMISTWDYESSKVHPRAGELSWRKKAEEIRALITSVAPRGGEARKTGAWAASGFGVGVLSVLGVRPVSRWLSGGY